MTSNDLDLRLQRFRSRRDEHPRGLASALIDAGRSHDALEVIQIGLSEGEPNIELLTLEGRAFYVQGDLQEAQRSLLRAAKIDPRNKEPYRWLAQVLIERGDAVRAVQVLERAIGLDPNDGSLRQAHARAQRLIGAASRKDGSPSVAPPANASRPNGAPKSVPPRAAAPASTPPPREAARRASERPPAAKSSPSAPPSSRPPPAPKEAAPRRGGIADLLARAGALRTRVRPAKNDAIARDLLREPSADRGSRAPVTQALPYDEEAELDDESPTMAVEVPDDMRAWLRDSQPRSGGPVGRAREQVLGADDDDDDESSVPTSIVPAHQELELLRAREAAQYEGQDDATLIEQAYHLAAPGQAEPPEQVLKMLQAQGVFETADGGAPERQVWLGMTEIPFVGTPIRRALAVGWGLALLAALGGYFGFQSWLTARRSEAAALVELARGDVLDGQHESLLAAERRLVEARTLDPKSDEALNELVFVQAARALDDGNGDLAPLRATLSRAAQNGDKSPIVRVAEVLARPAEQRKAELNALLALADGPAAQDARATYIAARIAQRAGELDATKRLLVRAVGLEPQLALAQVGLGEQARAEGQLEQAHEAFEKARGPDKNDLRAELWLAVLETKGDDTNALRQRLDDLMPRVERGSDSDKLLAYSARAFAAQAVGDVDKAKQALHLASALHVDDPELLAFFSEQALRAGEHTLSYRAARAANAAGGDAPRFQSNMAAAALQNDGAAALTALANLDEAHGSLPLARASAALLSDAREALEAAKKGLASYRITPAGKDDVEAAALLIRVDLRLGANPESLFPTARALVQREPKLAAPHLALAEAMIAAGQGGPAMAALEPALKLAPGSADAHYVLGCAQRLAGQPSQARSSFERAVALAPNHLEAQRALGRALLESGEFDAALSLFRGLEGPAGSSATLGVVEALIDKSNATEAAARLDALPAPVKAKAPAQLLYARLELARGNPLDAIKRLEPLVADDAESRTADSLALYGDALYAADRVDGAAAAYDAALELDETDPDALIGRAVTAVRANKSDQALSLLARAEAALVQHPRPPRVRAVLLMTSGRADLQKNPERAREELGRAVTLPSVPHEAYFWYGEALAKNRSENAIEQYARYLSLEPNGAYAARAKRALSGR